MAKFNFRASSNGIMIFRIFVVPLRLLRFGLVRLNSHVPNANFFVDGFAIRFTSIDVSNYSEKVASLFVFLYFHFLAIINTRILPSIIGD